MVISEDLLLLQKQVNKEYGEGAAYIASNDGITARFPTGSLSLDVATGGGFPGNQWIEIFGHESHGKTTLIYKAIAANMAIDPEFSVFWVASEKYESEQAKALGVDNSRVVVFNTRSLEDAYDMVLKTVASGVTDWVVIDSYPALIADEEKAKDMGESTMMIGARKNAMFFRKIGDSMKEREQITDKPFLGIFVNQLITDTKWSPSGVSETTPGGGRKNYSFYVRLEVKKGEWIEESRPGQGKVKVGQVIKIKTVKNKSAAPQKTAIIDSYFEDAPSLGFDRGDYDLALEIATMGQLYGVISRGGANYYIGDRKIVGKANMINTIRGELDLQDEIRAEVMLRSKRPDLVKFTEEDVENAANSGTKKIARKP